jgi:hypothetical protein
MCKVISDIVFLKLNLFFDRMMGRAGTGTGERRKDEEAERGGGIKRKGRERRRRGEDRARGGDAEAA